MPDELLFDRYRLLEPAGRGGSAEVWRARDERTGEEVAVKRLHPVVFADDAGKARLRREFDALRSLDEPHIVRVRDLVMSDREAALVLDYVNGESLAQRLGRLRAAGQRMAPNVVAGIVDDVAAALSAAHAAGIVHRDVTPGNILIGPDGEARLTDFGIAHASGDDASAVTATGLMMGTMRYLAPEQLRGGTSTPASDLHGLAAIAYEMLAGRPAYEPTSPVALAEAQDQGPPPIAGVSPEIDAAVRRGLAVDPASRPVDVAAFAAGLRTAVEVSSASAAAASDARTAVFTMPVGGVTGGRPISPDAVREPGSGSAGAQPVGSGAGPVGAGLLGAGVGVGGAGIGAGVGGAGGVMAADIGARSGGPAANAEAADIAVASPSRAALIDRPVALASLDRESVSGASLPASLRTQRQGGRRLPAPVVIVLGLLITVGLLAAATRLDAFPAHAPASLNPAASTGPVATTRPIPTPKPTPKPPGKGNDNGNGKGHDGKGD